MFRTFPIWLFVSYLIFWNNLWLVFKYPRLNFTSGVVSQHFVVKLSLHKMMLLDLLRVTGNHKIISLQNADWFLSSSYSKEKICHSKMTIGLCHEITWRYLRGIPGHHKMTLGSYYNIKMFEEGDTLPQQNDDVYLRFSMLAEHVPTSCCTSRLGFNMWISEGATSLATKWVWV